MASLQVVFRQKRWKSGGVRSGLRGGCCDTLQINSLMYVMSSALHTLACSLALSWRSNTSDTFLVGRTWQRPTFRLLSISLQRSQFIVAPTDKKFTRITHVPNDGPRFHSPQQVATVAVRQFMNPADVRCHCTASATAPQLVTKICSICFSLFNQPYRSPNMSHIHSCFWANVSRYKSASHLQQPKLITAHFFKISSNAVILESTVMLPSVSVAAVNARKPSSTFTDFTVVVILLKKYVRRYKMQVISFWTPTTIFLEAVF